MTRTKEQVIKDVEREVQTASREAFFKAMTVPFSAGDGTQTPEEYAIQHMERMANVFGKEMTKIVSTIYTNINDYTVGEGEDGVA